jgi:hypothetical protein
LGDWFPQCWQKKAVLILLIAAKVEKEKGCDCAQPFLCA